MEFFSNKDKIVVAIERDVSMGYDPIKKQPFYIHKETYCPGEIGPTGPSGRTGVSFIGIAGPKSCTIHTPCVLSTRDPPDVFGITVHFKPEGIAAYRSIMNLLDRIKCEDTKMIVQFNERSVPDRNKPLDKYKKRISDIESSNRKLLDKYQSAVEILRSVGINCSIPQPALEIIPSDYFEPVMEITPGSHVRFFCHRNTKAWDLLVNSGVFGYFDN